jgi:CRP/FNR family transcriptional regulator, dissimilatory nitrate respiration regulator
MIAIMSIFDQFKSASRTIRKGEHLFLQDDAVTSMYLIESGEIHLMRRQRNGAAIVLQRAQAGQIWLRHPCLWRAIIVMRLRQWTALFVQSAREDVRRCFETDAEFSHLWADHLASEVRAARLQVEILACRTVAERIDLWQAHNGALPDKGRWKELAAMIGTSPEALYREIAKRMHAQSSEQR